MLCAALAAGAAASVPLGPADPAEAAVPVGVSLREFRVTLYRPVVPRGDVRLNVRNMGEDGHNLEIWSRRGPLGALPELRPGTRGTLELTLRPGRYALVCTLADHLQRGMWVELRVRKSSTSRPAARS
jgi:hypothetical protein